MSHELDRTNVTLDDRDCWPVQRALHDEPKPRFGRYLGLINSRD